MDPITVELHDGEYHMFLRLDEIRAVQDARKTPYGTIIRTAQAHDWYIDDLIEVIRLGLIGGPNDLSPAVAKRKAEAYVSGAPKAEVWQVALAIIQASYVGYKKAADTRVDRRNSDDPFWFDMAAAIDFGRRVGFSPQQMREMTVADYVALVEGWNAEHDDTVPPPSVEEHEAWLKTVGETAPDEKVAA